MTILTISLPLPFPSRIQSRFQRQRLHQVSADMTRWRTIIITQLNCRYLTVSLNIFRLTLALIFGTCVPKVSKPHLGSISSSNWYEQRVDKGKNDYQHANLISFPVHFRWNVNPKKISKNFYCTKSFVLKFQGVSLELFLSYHVHFHRYRHFRPFWHACAKNQRNC